MVLADFQLQNVLLAQLRPRPAEGGDPNLASECGQAAFALALVGNHSGHPKKPLQRRLFRAGQAMGDAAMVRHFTSSPEAGTTPPRTGGPRILRKTETQALKPSCSLVFVFRLSTRLAVLPNGDAGNASAASLPAEGSTCAACSLWLCGI